MQALERGRKKGEKISTFCTKGQADLSGWAILI